eukprot:CAMPEP_0170178000 /NCGR_PEP_ID=MMETSP0040_2-20121228/11572_1 /TAXON_ID=641309 /ORGANISM="Lotharella oceanica, Strain CCMP622" /LENGTH=35 /DNA_ID= /DNA_START= /DNA_END= /DNA_ORIENTATION=
METSHPSFSMSTADSRVYMSGSRSGDEDQGHHRSP